MTERDFNAITDDEFKTMSQGEQARLLRDYGKSVGIEMDERTSRQLASNWRERQVEAENMRAGRQTTQRMRSAASRGGMYDAPGMEPWNEPAATMPDVRTPRQRRAEPEAGA